MFPPALMVVPTIKEPPATRFPKVASMFPADETTFPVMPIAPVESILMILKGPLEAVRSPPLEVISPDTLRVPPISSA